MLRRRGCATPPTPRLHPTKDQDTERIAQHQPAALKPTRLHIVITVTIEITTHDIYTRQRELYFRVGCCTRSPAPLSPGTPPPCVLVCRQQF